MNTGLDLARGPRQPVLFVGHGSPMNALGENAWGRRFRELGAKLPHPRAILAISAHWYGRGSLTTRSERPPTIHDFGGFPEELYEIEYAAPGDPALAARVAAFLAPWHAATTEDWGLDHGTWSVLLHVFPEADVPVVQLSIDAALSPSGQIAVGRALAPLRHDGVLIIGSGNVTHNLSHAFSAWNHGETRTPDWAARFDDGASRAIVMQDEGWLTRSLLSQDGRMAHPSPDHYAPLLYAFGASDDRDEATFPIIGFDMASLSMRAVLWT